MPSFFPALPQPAIVTHPATFKEGENQPIDAFVQGMGSGLSLSKGWMDVQKGANEMQREAATETALGEFAKTGDVGPVLQANPKVGLALRKEERQAATDKAKAEREMLVKAVEYADKALPYFATDQDPGPERWNTFRQHLTKFGLGHLVGPTWSKENVQQLIELKKDYAGRLGLEQRMELEQARSELRMNEFENKLLMKDALGVGSGKKGGKGDGGATVAGPLPAGMPTGLAAKLEKGGSTELFQRAWSLHKNGVQGTWPELIEEAQRGKVGVVNPLVDRGRELTNAEKERKAANAESEDRGDYEWYADAQKRKGWGVMTFDEWKANGKPTRRQPSQPTLQPGPAPAVPGGGLPQKALDQIRAANGEPVTFRNGQTWAVRNGQPVRVK